MEVNMNSKGHLLISLVKSAIRLTSCIIAYVIHVWEVIAIGFIIAELWGIVEELVDKR
jgi:hypothetical protein